MKKILCSLSALLMASALFAQVKEGTIIYERKINMHKRITDPQMRAMIPEFRTSKHQLLFSEEVALYKAVEETDIDPFANQGGGGANFVMRMGNDGGETFRNFTQARSVESTELGAKSYIIEDSIKQVPWKLTEETKKILTYTCKKATRTNQRGEVIEAWYTDAISCPAGPEVFSGLPGAILEVNINGGDIVYTAISVEQKVDKKALKEPTKGKKITREEFNKLRTEMMGNPGPGGRVIRIGG